MTTLRLNGHACREFVAANADIDAWLRRQPASDPAASPRLFYINKEGHDKMRKTETAMNKIVQQFINATNAFNVEAALMLFAPNAVIDDISVGEKFSGTSGVRTYLERFFVGYHTVSKLESVEVFDDRHAKAHIDFTGDFGHEKGSLAVTINASGRIVAIDAALE